MADRSPAPEPSDDEQTDLPRQDRSLFARWWWQGAMLAGTGVVVIVWQWDVITKGDAIGPTWAMVALGVLAVIGGALLVWKDRPRQQPPGDDA